MPVQVFTAGWLLPVADPPIADGAVAIAGARIVDVGAGAAVAARHPSATVRHLGADALVMPAALRLSANAKAETA